MTDISDVELLEYNTLKSKFEHFNRKYRKNHRDLEKSCSSVNKCLEELQNETKVEQIDKILALIRNIRDKNSNSINEEKKLANDCKKKIDHLKTLILSDEKASRNNEKVWKQESEAKNMCTELEPFHSVDYQSFVARFYRMLADYFFVRGNYISAQEIARNEFTSDLCLMDVYRESLEIKNDLLNGDTSSAHNWYQEVNYKLKKTQCSFEFKLRVFELYLLVKNGDKFGAILHARKYFGNMVQNNSVKAKKLGQAMVLLVLKTREEVEENGAKDELDEKWIIDCFHQVLLSFYEYQMPIPFLLAIKAGMSAIKTTYCYEARKNIDCAVCHPLVNKIAKDLPCGKHENSILSCYVTNTPMNDSNPPMVLPNGYVYSKRGIEMLTDDKDFINCPKTGERFSHDSVNRLYIV